MRHIRRIVIGAILGSALAVTMTASPAPAAQAAGVVVYVDDYPGNNGSTNCPATPHNNILSGVFAAGFENATVYVCPGTYTFNGVDIVGASKFKLIAKGEVVLKPTSGYTGDFLNFASSDNVTIQGFVIDANRDLGDGNAAAIRFQATSGSILKNSILGWREPDLLDSIADQRAISVFADATKKIKIDHNTIYDFQRTGISVDNVGPVTVTHNLLVATSTAIGYPMIGIYLGRLTSGTISANTIRSDSGFIYGSITSSGINLYASSGVTIKGNTVDGLGIGVNVTSTCWTLPTRDNTIASNKIINPAYYGIRIYASWSGPCPTLGTDHNTISGNTITSTGHTTDYGVYLTTQNDGVIDSTTIKSNKFYGFSSNIVGILGTITNSLSTGNKTYQYAAPGI